MGKILKIKHPDLTGQPKTTATKLHVATSTTLDVVNTDGFTASKYLLIEGFESGLSEIKLGGAITSETELAVAAVTFEHAAGITIQQLPYNQVEISYSTNLETLWDSGLYATIQDASDAATWAALVTTDITPSQEYTTYKDDSTESRSYRWRFKNETDTVYSDYITIILPDGFDEKQVSAIFRKATSLTNKAIKDAEGSQITTEFLMDILNEGLREVEQRRKRWSHNQTFEGTISEMTAGVNRYALPSNIEIRHTKTSIWNLRIIDGYNLTYIDKREMDIKHANVHHSQLAAELTNLTATATFDDTSNFPDSGTFTVWTGTTQDEVRYTANNRTTNVLTLTDASTDVTTTHAIDQNVWMNAGFGTPSYYTVYDGFIVFDNVPGTSEHQRNIDGDYYLKVQQVTSEDEYLRLGDPNIIINYVRWGISMKTNNDTKASQYEQKFERGLQQLRNVETTGQQQKLKPEAWAYSRTYTNRYKDN